MSAVVPQQRGVRMFLMPEAIVTSGSLRTLSGDALALYIAVTQRMYRMRSPDLRPMFDATGGKAVEILADTLREDLDDVVKSN